ncbi:Glutamate--tRNA ligase [Leucoagaricus sp. SymC.cos]|nr:Glutamate--tRNA ligase [Leucoagaricus sp. SymC.cos]
MVLLRFAPSPTGPLHLGGLRMALYNHLFARKHGGKWLLRIEDTDATRSVPGSVEGIRYALEWAGLEYDYGPGRDGPQAPYFQSERLDLYRTYSQRLLDVRHAYRCFCSPDRLAETREKLARAGSNATYDKACLHLTDEEVARRIKAGEKSIIRVNDSNLPTRSSATDLVFGQLKDAHASLPTDPVLLKTDLFPTYHLASIVDDHEMGITHVLRGEEWLPSLPLHLDLYASLRLTPPKFAHIPLLVNPDGSKMSKRNGDVQVIDYIRRGWEPNAILNWLALAGWGARHPEREQNDKLASFGHHDAPDSTAIMSLEELINEFDFSAMTHRSSSLDPAKLEYINKRHLMRTWSNPEGLEDLAEKVHEEIKERFPLSQYTSLDHIKDGILLLEGRLTNVYDIPIHAPWLFIEPDHKTREAQDMLKRISAPQLRHVITDVRAKLEQVPDPWKEFDFLSLLHSEQDRLGYSPKIFMKSLRHALTGMKDGPSMAEIMRVLGRERTISRLVVLPQYGGSDGSKL